MTFHDPLDAARAHVRLAVDHLRLSPEQAERLSTAHEAAIRRAEAGDGFTYTDGIPDTAAWLRHIEKANPALLGKSPTPAPAADKAGDWRSASFTELMAGIKAGSPTAQSELHRRTRSGDGAPSAPQRARTGR